MRRYHAPPPFPVDAGPRILALALGAILLLAGCSGEAPLPGDPLRVATTELPDPVLGEPYRGSIVVVGGLRPYQFRVDDGALPPGLSLQGGLILGTPTELGEFAFAVAASDGSLASSFRRFSVTVRDLPVPRFQIDVPKTEVRDDVTVRGRIAQASRLRAVRLRLEWTSDGPFPSNVEVHASRDDVALFWQVDEGTVAIDLAFLGPAFDGETELFRIDLATGEPVRLGFDLTTEMLYAGRRAHASEHVGATPQAPESVGPEHGQDASEGAP